MTTYIEDAINDTITEINRVIKNVQESIHFSETVSEVNQVKISEYLIAQLVKDNSNYEDLKKQYLETEQLKNDDPNKLLKLNALQRTAYGMAGSFKNNKLLMSNMHIGKIENGANILNITLLKDDNKETIKSAFNNIYLAMARIDPALKAAADKIDPELEDKEIDVESNTANTRKRDALKMYYEVKSKKSDTQAEDTEDFSRRKKVKVDYSRHRKN